MEATEIIFTVEGGPRTHPRRGLENRPFSLVAEHRFMKEGKYLSAIYAEDGDTLTESFKQRATDKLQAALAAM